MFIFYPLLILSLKLFHLNESQFVFDWCSQVLDIIFHVCGSFHIFDLFILLVLYICACLSVSLLFTSISCPLLFL